MEYPVTFVYLIYLLMSIVIAYDITRLIPELTNSDNVRYINCKSFSWAWLPKIHRRCRKIMHEECWTYGSYRSCNKKIVGLTFAHIFRSFYNRLDHENLRRGAEHIFSPFH